MMTVAHAPLHRRYDEIVLPSRHIKGRVVKVAPLQTINLARLQAGETMEIMKLKSAARYPGFFYLEITELQLSSCTAFSRMASRYFEQAPAEKMLDKQYYQPGEDEILRMETSAIVEPDTTLPAMLKPALPLLKNLIDTGESANRAVLKSLGVHTRTTSELKMTATQGRGGQTVRSGYHVAMILPETEHGSYTTEVHMPGSGLEEELAWAHVVPKTSCVLVGVRGAKHRISEPLPGEERRVWVEYEIR